MAYFVTGATGFIGQFLVRNLLKRRQPIYVLVRKSSVKKLDALRAQWGATDKDVIAVVGDLSKRNLGVADADLKKLKGKIDHLFHLAAIYDLKASADEQQAANVDGTRHAVQFAQAVTVGCFHHVSSIAAAGLYDGVFREDMFDEAEDLDIIRQLLRAHEYWRMKQLAVDLVILNEQPPSYAQNLQDALETQVRASQSHLQQEGHESFGGVFIACSPRRRSRTASPGRFGLITSRR